MAEMWFYTHEGRQMDAVTIDELKRLAADGALKPNDRVWKEGMAGWVRAKSVREIFYAAADEPGVATPGDGSRGEDEGGDIEKDSSYNRRARSRDDGETSRRRSGSGKEISNLGIILTIAFGAGVVLIFLAVGLAILVLGSRGNVRVPNIQAKAPPDLFNNVPLDPINPNNDLQPPVVVKEQLLAPDVLRGDGTISKELLPGQWHEFKWNVKAGVKASVIAIKAPGTPGADIKFSVSRASDKEAIATNARDGVNPGITFTLPVGEVVLVEVRNASKNNTIKCTITYNGGS